MNLAEVHLDRDSWHMFASKGVVIALVVSCMRLIPAACWGRNLSPLKDCDEG